MGSLGLNSSKSIQFFNGEQACWVLTFTSCHHHDWLWREDFFNTFWLSIWHHQSWSLLIQWKWPRNFPWPFLSIIFLSLASFLFFILLLFLFSLSS
jgi:hypothetical protein